MFPSLFLAGSRITAGAIDRAKGVGRALRVFGYLPRTPASPCFMHWLRDKTGVLGLPASADSSSISRCSEMIGPRSMTNKIGDWDDPKGDSC
ncbi:hypothetical protein RJZ57_000783, partial [Blastomyces gilchristii]